jgi:hypothetical protein
VKTAVFSTNAYDRQSLGDANKRFKHELVYHSEPLRRFSTVPPKLPALVG